jgi:lipid-A-disaccharide synthase
LSAVGIGGAQMAAQGFDAWWPMEKLAVRGYLEVLPPCPSCCACAGNWAIGCWSSSPSCSSASTRPTSTSAWRRACGPAASRRALRLPSIWAWRPEKLVKLKAAADHVLCLFPFEPELLAAHGIAATYVGHPLASVIPMQPDRAAARQALGLPPADPWWRCCRAAARPRSNTWRLASFRLQPQASAICYQFVVPAVPHCAGARAGAGAGQRAGRCRAGAARPVARAALAACDVTLIASGTATLEAALFKRPMVIAYAMPRLSGALMRRKRLQPWVGLPNILCAPRLAAAAGGLSARQAADAPARLRGARAAAGCRHAAALARAPCWTGWPRLRKWRPCRRALARCMSSCGATPRVWPPMRSKRFLHAEQTPFDWDAPGLVAGVDEAGRGPLAGPVVAAAVILDAQPIAGLADSKKLTARRRERLFDEIRAKACAAASPRPASRRSTASTSCRPPCWPCSAVAGLRLPPAKVLVDGNRLPRLAMRAEAIVKGDAKVRPFRPPPSWPRCTRPLVRRGRCAVAAIRLCRAQGLRHRRAPGGPAAHGPARCTGAACARGGRAGASEVP